MKRLSTIWSPLCTVIALATALLLATAAYGGYIDPRSWTPPAFAVMAFPVIATAAALVLALSVLLRQWRSAIIVAAALAATWPATNVHFPMNLSTPPLPASQDSTFTVLTMNVSGFINRMRHKTDPTSSTMRFILEQNADVVITQETALGPLDFTRTEPVKSMRQRIDSLYPYHSHGYHDIAILSKHPYTVLEDTTLKQGWMSPDNIHNEYHFYAKAFDVTLPTGTAVRIIGVHMQSIGLSDNDKELYKQLTRMEKGTRSQMSEVRHSLMGKVASACRRRAAEAQQLRTILDQSPENTIVCGDFNDTPLSFTYRTVRGNDMRDAWQDCAFWPTYTFNADRLYFHIDHMLYRGNLQALKSESPRAGSSDHYPIITTFAIGGK